MNDKEIDQLISYVVLLWPAQRDVDRREQIVAWGQLLHDVDGRAARAAIDEHAATGDRFPPPAGLIRQRAMILASGVDAPTSEQAWGEVVHQMSAVGHTGRPKFSHTAIAQVVESMGWTTLCRSEDGMADRAHFIRFYATAVEELIRQAVRPPSVIAIEETRLVLDHPRSETGSALPSTTVERDDEQNLDGVRRVRATLEEIRRRNRLDEGE